MDYFFSSSHHRFPLLLAGLNGLLLGLLLACQPEDQSPERAAAPQFTAEPEERRGPFAYRLDAPDAKQKLPSELVEISGLAWWEEEVLAAVQDEKGNVYRYDFAAEAVVRKIDFAGGGDYEGVTRRQNEIWVVRSDGRLYQLADGRPVQKFDTPLDEDFDVEGLTWYPKGKVFLLACKGFPGKGKALKGKKTIYAFDPAKGELRMAPEIVIDLAEVVVGRPLKARENAEEFFNPGKGSKVFQPSGIAVHPQSGDIYVIASVGKKLIVLSPRGKLRHVKSLNYKHFDQPEGICFAPDGRLYIASEGAGGKGKIMRFDPR